MPHLPNTTIVTQGKPSVLLGAPSGSKILLKEVGAFKTTTISEIAGIDISNVQDGDVLHFDGIGLNWVNDDPTTFGLVTVDGTQTLINKTLTTPNVDQIKPTATLVVDGDLSANDYSGIDATLTGDVVLTSAVKAYYLGDPSTDGTWRFVRNGTNLEVQLLVLGTFVAKGSFTP